MVASVPRGTDGIRGAAAAVLLRHALVGRPIMSSRLALVIFLVVLAGAFVVGQMLR